MQRGVSRNCCVKDFASILTAKSSIANLATSLLDRVTGAARASESESWLWLSAMEASEALLAVQSGGHFSFMLDTSRRVKARPCMHRVQNTVRCHKLMRRALRFGSDVSDGHHLGVIPNFTMPNAVSMSLLLQTWVLHCKCK